MSSHMCNKLAVVQKILTILLLLVLYNKYGVKATNIAYGKIVSKDQFPFFVQIKVDYTSFNGSWITGRCSGTLIHPRWVLTAGHCFPENMDEVSNALDKAGFIVFAGAKIVFDSRARLNQITELRRHPNYCYNVDNKTFHVTNDIAVAKLKKRYEINRFVKCVTLAPPQPSNKCRCKVGVFVGIKQPDDEGLNTYISHAKIHPMNLNETSNPDGVVITNTENMFFSEIMLLKGYEIEGGLGEPFLCYVQVRCRPKTYAYVQYGIDLYEIKHSCTNTKIVAFESVDKHLDFIQEYVPTVRIYGVKRYPKPKLLNL